MTTTTTTTRTQGGAACPACGLPTVTERGATPWCAKCGWNLDLYEPARRRRDYHWKWIDRLTFRAAYRLNASEFAHLAGQAGTLRRNRPLAFVVGLIAVILLACEAGLAAGGIALIVLRGGFIGWVGGVFALMLAVYLAPRFGRVPKDARPVTAEQAPTLHKLVGEVAAATGGKVPHTIIVNSRFNAYAGSYGIRRRRVLTIGVPLWLALDPQEQVALLGHELGHFVNGDVRRGPVTVFAFKFFERLRRLTDSDSSTDMHSASRTGPLGALATLIADLLLALLNIVFGTLNLFMVWLTLRASQSAEYAADNLGEVAGGSEALASLQDRMLVHEAAFTLTKRALRGGGEPAQWRAEIRESLAELDDRLPRLRQLSLRDEASLFRAHPPTGLRAERARAHSPQPAKVLQDAETVTRIDQELSGHYRAMRAAEGW